MELWRQITDAHCHVPGNARRHFLCYQVPHPAQPGNWPEVPEPIPHFSFVGCHPWCSDSLDIGALEKALAADATLGIGEIGLDKVEAGGMSPSAERAFDEQLKFAAKYHRPVVLHGAKCWGKVVAACKQYAKDIPAFLFHSFSRSCGLIPDIEAMNGFISIGPAVMNDHAVNYRRMAAQLPLDMLLVETDRTGDAESDAGRPSIEEIAKCLALVRSMEVGELVDALEANADRFIKSLTTATTQDIAK